MDYSSKLLYHYKPKSGWVNDPNGLVYFNGYYHIFYQHAPDFELPWKQPMHWGHAITKDFLCWEELPVALYPDQTYDNNGCWSGSAIVQDGVLYLFYASVYTPANSNENIQTISIAYSTDGIHFIKYKNNPVIKHYPDECGPDFRDPAVCCTNGIYYCIIASGNSHERKAHLLLYKSSNLFDWIYCGIIYEWDECKYAECPSFMTAGDKFLLATSVCPIEKQHYFSLMFGEFKNEKFIPEYTAEVDKGPDQYAGQIFLDHKGRNILISWIPGWLYQGYAEHDVGCMSIPREIKLLDGKIKAYPVEEVKHLLKDCDSAVKRTDDGFIIERTGREPIVYKGDLNNLKIIHDEYIMEVFVNDGEEVYTALL